MMRQIQNGHAYREQRNARVTATLALIPRAHFRPTQ